MVNISFLQVWTSISGVRQIRNATLLESTNPPSFPSAHSKIVSRLDKVNRTKPPAKLYELQQAILDYDDITTERSSRSFIDDITSVGGGSLTTSTMYLHDKLKHSLVVL